MTNAAGRRRAARSAAVLLAAAAPLCFSACGGPKATGEGSPPPPARTVLVGLIPEQNIFRQLERYRPLAGYLSARTGARVEVKVLSRYGNILRNFSSEGLDGAFFGSFTYVLAHERLGVVPLVRPVLPDGRSTYHGVILARKDRGIRTARDLKGKQFAFVDRATTAGYLLPIHWLAESGIRDYRSFLGDSWFAGTHEDVIRDVVAGRADAGAAKNTVLERMGREDPAILESLTVLARSPDVPENGLALRAEFDPALRAALRAALLGMPEDPEGRGVLARFGARGWIETSDADYEPVYRYARESGIDPAHYEYDNH